MTTPADVSRRARTVSRLLASVLIADLLFSGRYVRVLFRDPPTDLVLVLCTYLTLVVLCIAGLLLLKGWGFLAGYVLAPYSTVMLSDPLVPFVTDLLPTVPMQILAVTLLNALFLIVLAYAHWSYRRGRSVARVVDAEGVA